MTKEVGDHPLISFAVEADTVHVRDELAGQDLRLTAAEEPTIQPAMTDLFLFPVDDAITVTASKLQVESHGGSAIWDGTGEHLGEFTTEPREFTAGEYYLQVVGTVNGYLRIVDAPFSVSYELPDSRNSLPLFLEFPEPTQISLGARSLHSRPAATITVPDDPAALREAIPYLGSSIKEFSCERSWPSLRGHPPRLERGDRLDVPPNLSKPDTGVTITVPETYADVYRIAPLAFYLGADVEAADRAALHLENGYTEPLSTTAKSLEESVDELLGTCLLLDSLTRVDGYFSQPRYEYDELAPHLGFYPPNLYGESLTDQLMEYLEVSPSLLEPFLPQWPTTTVLQPRPADAELLPYALDALSRIHVRTSPRDRDAKSVDSDPQSLVTAYSHSDPPTGTGRLIPTAFENALTHCLPAPSDARLGFVTIDADRADRLAHLVNDVAAEHGLPGDAVSIVHAQTGDELERELARESDFLYSEVPVSSDGFECANGRLRLRDCTDIGVKTFAVHGAASSDAGLELLKRGAVAGLAIEEAVSAPRIARLTSSLLRGHSFAESARFAEIGATASYRFVGDASRTAVRCDGGANPVRIDIESVGTDEHELSVWSKPTDIHRLGSVSRLIEESVRDAYQLVGAKTRQPLGVTTSEVVSYLEDEEHVAWLNGRPYHGESEATETFVRDSARRTIDEVR